MKAFYQKLKDHMKSRQVPNWVFYLLVLVWVLV